MTPKLTITTSARGLERVVVHHDNDDKNGFALLRRVLPALESLDRRARRGADPNHR